jgi:hypothetical protein
VRSTASDGGGSRSDVSSQLRVDGARRGAKKAIIAVAASMLTAAYHILRASVPYKDLGPEHFNRRDKEHAARRLQSRLEDLGFAVEIRPTIAGVSI